MGLRLHMVYLMVSSREHCLQGFNTLRPRQNGRHFPDDIFKCFFLNENVWIYITISLKFVPKGLINNIPALVQIMAWRRPGDKPLSEPMMVSLLTHICVTRPQWVNWQQAITGSGSGFSPNGWQAIISTNHGQVHWRTYTVSMSDGVSFYRTLDCLGKSCHANNKELCITVLCAGWIPRT